MSSLKFKKTEEHSAPIFLEDAGSRMKRIRMKLLFDQAQLGELLGISQQQISKLESGHLSHPPFTMGRFRAVFGIHADFILLGSDKPSWWYEGSDKAIHKTYWETKLKKERKPGSGLWKSGLKKCVE